MARVTARPLGRPCRCRLALQASSPSICLSIPSPSPSPHLQSVAAQLKAANTKLAGDGSNSTDACSSLRMQLDTAQAELGTYKQQLAATRQQLQVTDGLLSSTQATLDRVAADLSATREAAGALPGCCCAAFPTLRATVHRGGATQLAPLHGAAAHARPRAHAPAGPLRPAPPFWHAYTANSLQQMPQPADQAKVEASDLRGEWEYTKEVLEGCRLTAAQAAQQAALLQEGLSECQANRFDGTGEALE